MIAAKIAAYRLVPLISNNVRTLFCGTAKLSPKRKRWMVHLLEKVKTFKSKTCGANYQLLEVRSNVRLLLIDDEKAFEDKRSIHCAIRIGAGAEEDPDEMHGRAHLLEHTISLMNPYFTKSSALTGPQDTVYSVQYLPKDRNDILQRMSETLFSEDTLEHYDQFVKKIIEKERDRVDSEYIESRSGCVSFPKLLKILERCGLTLTNFDCGHKTMLIGDGMDDDQKNTLILKELNTFRDIYRRRPVNICFYSAQKQNMESILNLLNVDNFLQNGIAEAANQDWPKRQESKIKFSKQLIVSSPNDDSVTFHIIFPQTKTLNRREFHTIDFFCGMISLDTEGCLKRCLLEKKWATNCTARLESDLVIIDLHLTTGPNGGLANISKVVETIQKYLTFLHDHWAQVSEFMYREHWNDERTAQLIAKEKLEHARYITSFWILDDEVMEKTEFDELDFFEALPNASEQTLIKELILDNTKGIFAISIRDRNLVLHDLGHVLKKDQPRETEPMYGGNYSIFEIGDLFKNETISGCQEFKLVDWRTHKGSHEGSYEGLHKLPVCLEEANDNAYQQLLATHLTLELARFYPISTCGSFAATFDYIEYEHPPGALPCKNFFTDFNCRDMTEEDFDMSREHLMRDQSKDMTDSKIFATNLMAVAVANLNYTMKMDPLPMQYKTLKDMTHQSFTDRLKELDPEIIKPNWALTNIGVYAKSVGIKSINRNEMSTVTLLFCQTDDESNENVVLAFLFNLIHGMRTEKNLYTVQCENKPLCDFNGLLVTICSVENKEGQKRNEIMKSIGDIFMTEIPKLIDGCSKEDQAELNTLYDNLTDKMIVIQVYGYEQSGDNEESFESQFDKWYEENADTVKKLCSLN